MYTYGATRSANGQISSKYLRHVIWQLPKVLQRARPDDDAVAQILPQRRVVQTPAQRGFVAVEAVLEGFGMYAVRGVEEFRALVERGEEFPDEG